MADAKPRRRRRWWFVPLALALPLLLGEAALRLYVFARGWTANCYAAHLDLFQPDPETGYRLRPGFTLRSGAFRMSITAAGFRGPPLEPTPPAGTVRIAVVGESSGFGYFVSDGAEWPRRLEAELRSAGRKVEVLNAAVPSFNLNQHAIRWERDVQRFRPMLALWYLGWNDLPYVASDQPDAPRHVRREPAAAWERVAGHSVLYGAVAHRLLGRTPRFAPAVRDGAKPTEAGAAAFRANLRRLKQVCEGIPIVVVAQLNAGRQDVAADLRGFLQGIGEDPAELVALSAWLKAELRAFAAAEGVPFLDANELPADRATLADQIHLTAAGETRLAELLAPKLLPLLPALEDSP